jgi:phosphatidate cytidylyltransferase
MRTRFLTALVLVPLTIAALFLLPPREWGAITLAIVVLAGSEWAFLAGYGKDAEWLVAIAVALLGSFMLFSPWTALAGRTRS